MREIRTRRIAVASIAAASLTFGGENEVLSAEFDGNPTMSTPRLISRS